MTRRLLIATLLVTAVSTQMGEAYLRISPIIDGRRLFFQVSPPSLRIVVSDQGVPGVSPAQMQAAITRAGETWQAVPSSAFVFQSVGITSAQPGVMDGQNTIGFVSDLDDPDLLGLTLIIFDAVTGDIVEADVAFNNTFEWSVAENGEEDKFDFESVALHELGHMLGLGHSGLAQMETGRVAAAETAMFPISYDAGTIAGRQLRADDIAGASLIYPDGGFLSDTGTLSGRVELTGRPVFGAHIMAFNPGTGTMVGGFTYENGEFLISGLSPGAYILRVEPIDDGDTSSFFDEVVDVSFKTMFLNRLVTVQRGTTTPRVDIVVEPK